MTQFKVILLLSVGFLMSVAYHKAIPETVGPTQVFNNFELGLPADSLTNERKEQIISKIKTLLIEIYIFEDIAIKCTQKIDSFFSNGSYDKIYNYEQFAEILTKDMQGLTKDKHLELVVNKQNNNKDPRESVFKSINNLRRSGQKSNFRFKKVEILEGNIGYLDFRAFYPGAKVKGKVSAAMKFLSDCDALIIDLRENTGGDPNLTPYICSYFFEKPTLLETLYVRKENLTVEYWTHEVKDVKTLFDVPIYILTCAHTFSAPEGLAYDLQSREKATVIGEQTGGGAHVTSGFRVDDSFVIHIPRSRSINPITKTDWEGIGVKPDIYAGCDEALEKALEVATIEAKKHRIEKENYYDQLILKIEDQIEQTGKAFSKKYDSIKEKELFEILDQAVYSELLDESSLNHIGYEYLSEQKILLAISLFKYSVFKYPNSSNAYNSLGEAYLEFGEKELAIKNYNKSLELDPNNEDSKQKLKELKFN